MTASCWKRPTERDIANSKLRLVQVVTSAMKIALGNSDRKPSSDWVQATHSRFYKYEFFYSIFYSVF